jgi:predicted deacylase
MLSTVNKILAGCCVVLFVALSIWIFAAHQSEMKKDKAILTTATTTETISAPETTKHSPRRIGTSSELRPIELYSFGKGEKHITFVGGVHGGYEWNSTLLAYTYIDYLIAHPDEIPLNLTIDIIPTLNPDGLYIVTNKEGRFTQADVSHTETTREKGRFNAHSVDLNRNFDCKWQAKSTWKSQSVSAGSKAFSEPEAAAFKRYIDDTNPRAVVFWHSQANGVFASRCTKGILPETTSLMNTYAKASRYKAINTFDAYTTTGAADDWLASVDTPAVTVELSSHNSIEWDKNIKGIKAVLSLYTQSK